MSRYLGSHVGMKSPKYLEGSIEEALSYGATACMVFSGAPRNKVRKPVGELHLEQARKLLENEPWSFEQVIVHAPYIINLANTENEKVRQESRELLAQEIRRTEAMGSRYLVLHPGSHLKKGKEKGIASIVEQLDSIFGEYDGPVQVALETMAGKGSEIGRSFEEIRQIIDSCSYPEKLCVCLDTCHIHDAGYDLEDLDTLLADFDRILGLDRLRVIHVNNSKNEKGSGKDRHENLLYGKISLDALSRLVHDPRLEETVMVLETPWRDEQPVYKEEIELLRSWRESS